MKKGFFVAWINRPRLSRLGFALLAALLIALPRLTNLSGYLIVDEPDRWHWAEEFYRALIAGDLRATLVGDGYPGIVPVWLEAIWLLGESLRRSIVQGGWFGDEGVYMLFHVWGRTSHLAQQRLPIVLFNSLLALLMGWYGSKSYGRRVGLVATVLIALDPFLLADSRVNRAEAVITGLLTLSILFLVRYRQTGRRRWLIASGLMGGFSLLTKIQGLVILPTIVAILLFYEFSREGGGRGAKSSLSSHLLVAFQDGLVWGLTAVLIWVVVWPAMWVRPLDVLTLVFDYATRKVESEGVNLFFIGQHFYNQDPGPLFYPIVAFLRMTPLTMLGLALGAWQILRRFRGQFIPHNGVPRREGVVVLLIYVVLYTGAMTLGSHKQDRYLMPIFPALDILAAMGWVYSWEWLTGRWSALRASRWTLAAFGGLLAVQVVSVLPYHPYYFPYFNPLLGGGRVGARTLRVGWGEGMDQVASYLNTKPDAANLTVAARWYHYMFGFVGDVVPFDGSGRWTQADYVVLYIHQTQRMLDPSPGIIRYFQGRQPEHIVRINGIDYAQIYPSPFTRPAQPGVSVIPGQAALLGYRWGDSPSSATGIEDVKVIWENLGLTRSPQLVAAVTDGADDSTWYACQTARGFEVSERTPGEVVESECDLSLPAGDLPPGVYDLRFGLENSDASVDPFLFPGAWRSVAKEEDGAWRPVTWLESLEQIARHQVPPAAKTVDVYYQGQIRLVAYNLNATALQAGQSVAITLYWQALAPVEEDYMVFNHLFGLEGTPVGEADEWPAVPTSRWLPGQVMTTTHIMPTDPGVPAPVVASLDIGLYDAERRALPVTDRHGQPVPVTMTRIKFVPAAWPERPPPIAADALFGDSLLLEGYSSLPDSVTAGEAFTLETWWQVTRPPETDYTLFIHLLDASGNIVAQADGAPLDGRYPTSAWERGELIIDLRSLALPADLPGGEYQLIVGLYNPLDGARLSLAEGTTDFFNLGVLKVSP